MQLFVHHMAWQKLLEYVRQCPVEINGFAYVKVLNNQTLAVTSPDDVFITEQEVSAGSADNTADTVAMAMAEAASAGRASELRLQWHSHVNGAARFSSIDTGTMESYGRAGSQWMLSLVTNKRGETELRLDVYQPFRFHTDVQLVTYLPEEDPMRAQCAAEIAAKVKQKKTTPPKRPKRPRWKRQSASAAGNGNGTASAVAAVDDADEEAGSSVIDWQELSDEEKDEHLRSLAEHAPEGDSIDAISAVRAGDVCRMQGLDPREYAWGL